MYIDIYIYEQRISKLCLITWGYINMFQLQVTTRCCITMTIMTTHIYIYIWYIHIYIWYIYMYIHMMHMIWYIYIHYIYINMMHLIYIYSMNVSIDFCTVADQLHPNLIPVLVCQSRIEETYGILLYPPWFILFTLVYSLYIFSEGSFKLPCENWNPDMRPSRCQPCTHLLAGCRIKYQPNATCSRQSQVDLHFSYSLHHVEISLPLISCCCCIYPKMMRESCCHWEHHYIKGPLFWWKSMFVFSMHMWITDESRSFPDRSAHPPDNLAWPWKNCHFKAVNHLEMNHFHL